jgi:hypothetical protein
MTSFVKKVVEFCTAIPAIAVRLLRREPVVYCVQDFWPDASIAAGVAELASANPGCLAEMGRAGRDFYNRELSLAAGATRFERVFRAALN